MGLSMPKEATGTGEGDWQASFIRQHLQSRHGAENFRDLQIEVVLVRPGLARFLKVLLQTWIAWHEVDMSDLLKMRMEVL